LKHINGKLFIARILNKKIRHKFSEENFAAWHLHNAIDVGAFENFLPALYTQRENLDDLHYSKDMNSKLSTLTEQKPGFDETLQGERVKGYQDCSDPYEYQQGTKASFLLR